MAALPEAIEEVRKGRDQEGASRRPTERIDREELAHLLASSLSRTDPDHRPERSRETREERDRKREHDIERLRLHIELERLRDRVVSIVGDLNQYEQLRELLHFGLIERETFRELESNTKGIIRGLSYLSARHLGGEAEQTKRAVPGVLLRRGREYYLELGENLASWDTLLDEIERRLTSPESVGKIRTLDRAQIEKTVTLIRYVEACRKIPGMCKDLSRDVMELVDETVGRNRD